MLLSTFRVTRPIAKITCKYLHYLLQTMDTGNNEIIGRE